MIGDDGIAAFLAARLDEEEPPEICGCLDADHWPPCAPQPAAERKRREIKAMRAILARHVAAQAWSYPPGDGDEAVQDELGEVIRHLAAVWCDHPDYREEWKPLTAR